MFPKITSDVTPISPLAATLKGQKTADTVQTVGMAELSSLGVLDLRGRDTEKIVKKVYKPAPKAIGDVTTVEDGTLARLRDDHFVLLTDNIEAAADKLTGEAGRLTVTDVTHGRAVMRLMGPNAPDVLSKVCALDFAAFPNNHAAQTSMAKVKTLIIRQDRAYILVVDQSLAAYTWDVVFDATLEFGGVVMKAQ